MNFLGHAYLSFENRKILVGNMISDFVKGAQKDGFEKDVRQGIVLHRSIDHFTDEHPATREARSIFRPHYRLYSSAILDIIWDHFLANDASAFPEQSLYTFSQQVYNTLDEHHVHLPLRFQTLLPYMKAENWLYYYKDHAGMEKSLSGLVRRSKYLTDSDTAYQLFLEHYDELSAFYESFFPDVKQFAKEKLQELLTG